MIKTTSSKRTYHVIETFEDGKSTGFVGTDTGRGCFIGYLHSCDIKFAAKFTSDELAKMPNVWYGDTNPTWIGMEKEADEHHTRIIELVPRKLQIEKSTTYKIV